MPAVAFTDEFREWFDELSPEDQVDVAAGVELLEDFGVSLPFPHSSDIKNCRFAFRELRRKAKGAQLRVIYAFNPVRQAILIIGGAKGGDDRFYDWIIPKAEKLWEQYLRERAWESDADDSEG